MADKLLPLATILLLSATTQACLGSAQDSEEEALPAETDTAQSGLVTTRRLKLQTRTRSAVNQLAEPEKAVANGVLRGQQGDFDGDGKTDTLTTKARGFTIDYGNGTRYEMTVPDPEMSVQAVEPIMLGPNNAVSFLVATADYSSESWWSRKPQLLVRKVNGTYQTKVLSHLNIIGRDVTCTKVNVNWDIGVCMFASYGKEGVTYSTLVEVDAAGKVVDVTSGKGLPWMGASGTRVSGDKYVNGKYMMGFAWVDLNGDGLPDLVGGGQHSQLVYMLMQKTGATYTFGKATWFDKADEYLGVSSLRKNYYDFPCVYVHVEAESTTSPRGDYVTCFDKGKKTWTRQELPAVTTTGESIKRYELQTKNSNMDDVGGAIFFSTRAHLANGTVELFAIRAVEADGTPPIVRSTMRSEVFDPAYYLELNADLGKAFGGKTNFDRAAYHWQVWGIDQGRRASPTFWSKKYLEKNEDVASGWGATNYEGAINHYVKYGIDAGRPGI